MKHHPMQNNQRKIEILRAKISEYEEMLAARPSKREEISEKLRKANEELCELVKTGR